MTNKNSLAGLLDLNRARSERDAKRFEEHDSDLCMLCFACGGDMRSLFVSCLYAVHEAVPEAIDLWLCGEGLKDRGYYLCICKTCRGTFLTMMESWRTERIALREIEKDSDGFIPLTEANIPVRVHGAVVMMTKEQYAEYLSKKELQR